MAKKTRKPGSPADLKKRSKERVRSLVSGAREAIRAKMTPPDDKAAKPAEDDRKFSTYQHVLPHHLACISDMRPDKGYVHVRTLDGKEHVWPAARVGFMAQDCLKQLQHLHDIIRSGKSVNPRTLSQLTQLMEMSVKAYRAAQHQREALSKHDTEGNAVDRMLTSYEWQKGMHKDLGSYTDDHLPEDANLKHYAARYPGLEESEIATILRAKEYPWALRQKMLETVNAERLIKELNLNEADIKQMVATGQIPEHAMQRVLAVDRRQSLRQKAAEIAAASDTP